MNHPTISLYGCHWLPSELVIRIRERRWPEKFLPVKKNDISSQKKNVWNFGIPILGDKQSGSKYIQWIHLTNIFYNNIHSSFFLTERRSKKKQYIRIHPRTIKYGQEISFKRNAIMDCCCIASIISFFFWYRYKLCSHTMNVNRNLH